MFLSATLISVAVFVLAKKKIPKKNVLAPTKETLPSTIGNKQHHNAISINPLPCRRCLDSLHRRCYLLPLRQLLPRPCQNLQGSKEVPRAKLLSQRRTQSDHRTASLPRRACLPPQGSLRASRMPERLLLRGWIIPGDNLPCKLLLPSQLQRPGTSMCTRPVCPCFIELIPLAESLPPMIKRKRIIADSAVGCVCNCHNFGTFPMFTKPVPSLRGTAYLQVDSDVLCPRRATRPSARATPSASRAPATSPSAGPAS